MFGKDVAKSLEREATSFCISELRSTKTIVLSNSALGR